MPTKAEQYAQMADQVARQLTGSWQVGRAFSPPPPASTNIRSMNS